MDEIEAKKKRSLRNEKLKAKRASETEEQRKERLRIRLEKDRERRRTKKLQEEKTICDLCAKNQQPKTPPQPETKSYALCH